MIDHDDADDFWLASMFSSGPIALICFVIFIVLTYYACKNEQECAAKSCANGKAAILSEHRCLCVEEAN